MRDLLLIKKINPTKELDKTYPYTFVLGESFTKKKAMEIFLSLKDEGIAKEDEFIIKDKTITLSISVKNITKVIKKILDKDLDIYGIYVPYVEYLEKGRINE